MVIIEWWLHVEAIHWHAIKKGKELNALLRELSDGEEDTAMETVVPDDPQRPWLREYSVYVDVAEQVPEGWSAVHGGV
jgi:hypothetical protein